MEVQKYGMENTYNPWYDLYILPLFEFLKLAKSMWIKDSPIKTDNYLFILKLQLAERRSAKLLYMTNVMFNIQGTFYCIA